MTEQVWGKFLTEGDKQVFAASGYAARAGFGKRPTLLVMTSTTVSPATRRSQSSSRSSTG
jgi:hypothetical protein